MLWDGGRQREHGPGVHWSILGQAFVVVEVCGGQRIDLRREEGGQDNCLSKVFGKVVKVHRSYASEVAAMSVFRQKIQLGKDVLHMLPILHEQSFGLVYYNDLGRGQERVLPSSS